MTSEYQILTEYKAKRPIFYSNIWTIESIIACNYVRGSEHHMAHLCGKLLGSIRTIISLSENKTSFMRYVAVREVEASDSDIIIVNLIL